MQPFTQEQVESIIQRRIEQSRGRQEQLREVQEEALGRQEQLREVQDEAEEAKTKITEEVKADLQEFYKLSNEMLMHEPSSMPDPQPAPNLRLAPHLREEGLGGASRLEELHQKLFGLGP